MSSTTEKKSSSKLAALRLKAASDGRKIFQLAHKKRQLEAEKEQKEKELEKYENIYKKRKAKNLRDFNAAEYEKKIDEKKIKIQEMQSEIEKLGDRIKLLENESGQTNTVNQLQAKIKELEQKLAGSEETAAKATQTNAVFTQTMEEDAMNDQVKELHTKNKELKQKLADCENERDAQKLAAEDLAQKNATLEQTNKEDAIKCQKLQSIINDTVSELKTKNEKLEHENALLNQTNKEDATEFVKLQAIINDQLRESKTKIEELEQKLAVSENERDAQKSTAEDLAQKNVELNQKIKEDATIIDDQQKKLLSYEKQLKTKDDQMAKLQEELTTFKNDKQMLQNKFDQLQETTPSPEPPLNDPQICSTCSKEWHEPIDCELLKLWLKKCAEEANEPPTAESERFHRYYNSYVKQRNRIIIEQKPEEKILKKIQQLSAKLLSIETQLLLNAAAVLKKCRQTLMYTYAFAYYLKPNNGSSYFESNLEVVEFETEKLFEMLEREFDFDSDDLVKFKRNVQVSCQYVDRRREVLLGLCVEGVERGACVFNIKYQQIF